MATSSPLSWDARYHTAAAWLDDTAQLVALWRYIQVLQHQQEPAADFFGTNDKLSGAGRIGLFAGTFNPLTLAHTALVEAASTRGGIDRVLWTLALASIDKESVARATIVDRLVQLLASVAVSPSHSVMVVNRGLYVDEVDIAQSHLTGEPELVVLVGYDKIVQIFDPRYYSDRSRELDDLFGRARFLVAPRDANGSAELEALLARPENSAYRRQVDYLPLTATYRDDSATLARSRAAKPGVTTAELRRLLPPEGVALALETLAYVESTEGGGDTTQRGDYVTGSVDLYAWRSRWTAALGSTVAPVPARLPGMKRLVQATVEPSARGARLRSFLRADRTGASSAQDLASLLDGI